MSTANITQEFTYSLPPLPTADATGLHFTDVTNVFKNTYQGICPSLVRAVLHIFFNYNLPVNPLSQWLTRLCVVAKSDPCRSGVTFLYHILKPTLTVKHHETLKNF